MKLARPAFGLVLVSLMAGLVQAQPGGGGRSGGGRGGFGGPPWMQFERMADNVKKLDLSDDQKEKFETLKKEYSAKFDALKVKGEAVLTDDQKKARADALKAAKEATGADRRAAYRKVMEAVTLTDDQKKEMEPIMKDGQTLLKDVRTKVSEILTDEQKEKLKAMVPARGGRGPGGNSAPKKEKEST